MTDTTIAALPASDSASEARFRSEMGQISKQSSVYLAGMLFTTAVGYFFKIYVARMLGAGALGIYALGMTLVGFLGLFNGLGIPQTAVRFVAAYSATRQYDRLHVFLRRAIGVLTALNIVLVIAMIQLGPWLVRRLYHDPELIPYLPLFGAILVVGALGGFFGQVLAGYKDVALRTVITNFIATPVNVLLGLVLLSAGLGLRGYVLAQIASGTVGLCLLLAAAWKLTPLPARHAPAAPVVLETDVYRFSAAVLGVSFLEFLLSQVDKIILGAFSDVQHVGVYAVAVSLVAFVPITLQSVNQIFSPVIADLHARGEHALLNRLFQTATKWIIGFTLPLAFIVMIYSKPLMLLFGSSFEAGWTVLVIGTLGQLVNAGVGSVGYLLLMSGNQIRLVRVQAMMAVLVVALTFALVKPFGISCVACAGAVTNAATNYLCLREVRKALGLSPYNRTYLYLIPPAIATLGVAFLVKFAAAHFQLQWVWIVVALVMSYATFAGLCLLFGLDNDDKMILNAVKSRIRGLVRR